MFRLGKISFTWSHNSEQIVVTELLICPLPASGGLVTGHRPNPDDAQGEVCLHCVLVVVDRLALVGGSFENKTFLQVVVIAADLVLCNAISVLSRVANWVLVATIDVLEAGFNAVHLLEVN